MAKMNSEYIAITIKRKDLERLRKAGTHMLKETPSLKVTPAEIIRMLLEQYERKAS